MSHLNLYMKECDLHTAKRLAEEWIENLSRLEEGANVSHLALYGAET